MSKPDYYETLEVARTATDEEIKKAYKKRALQYHPDRNPDNPEAEEKFKACSEAFEVLHDPEKRRAYDQFGHAGLGGGGNGGAGFDFSGNFSDIFEDFFGDVFGGGGKRRRGPQRGSDLQYRLEIPFREAVFGGEREIVVPRHERCETCQGSGAKPGTNPITCTQCGGSGQIRQQQGFFSVSRGCPVCRGAGKVISDPCKSCRGAGRNRKERKLKIKIPAGVDTGLRLKLENEGELSPASGGAPGDLFVVLEVGRHSIFEREGQEIICRLPISFPQAALGAEIEVPTLDGPVKMTLPAGTQTGRVFRLKGKGIPRLGGGPRGDQHVQVQIEVPAKLKKNQRELLEAFAGSLGVDDHPAGKGFFEKVKEIFQS